MLYYARLSNQLSHLLPDCEQYILLLQQHRYYNAYADCAKTLNKLRRVAQTMAMLREGAKGGVTKCA